MILVIGMGMQNSKTIFDFKSPQTSGSWYKVNDAKGGQRNSFGG